MKCYKMVAVAAACLTAAVAQDLTADMIQGMGNNSLFTRWRATSHILAPAGWMNDPCGAMYDPTRDTYHIFYQWHPNHIDWGNISWGHATSKDLISWTDVGGWEGNSAEALATGGGNNDTYNGLGIFSGTAQPVNLQGEQDGTLALFYTSVQYLPTNWRLPYIPGTESQSIALSTDGGETWEDYENNPVIEGVPGDWNITGFRDPFVEPWPAMDALLGQDEPHYYAVFGSGIKPDVGPRVPFWSAPANDLTNWTFLGALWEPEANNSLGSVLATGTDGFNYEVSGFFSLADDEGHLHYYANVGTEGGNVTNHPHPQWSLWYEGTVSRRANGSAAFNPIAGGAADYGIVYAITSFNDTKRNRRIQYGWAREELAADGTLFSATQQGYQGALAFPREVFVLTTRRVVNNDGLLGELGPSAISQELDGTFTARTLGVRPLPELVTGLRNGTTQVSFPGGTFNESTILAANTTNHYELTATVSNVTGRVGVRIGVSPDDEEYTLVYYEPSNYTVVIEKSRSSLIQDFNNASFIGYFRPYHTLPAVGGNATVESLRWDIFVDGSLVEVYINDRFAMTARIYPSMESSTGVGVYLAEGASATYENVNFWDGLYNVWPERPLNSSSELVFDTAEQTNNYTWWSGN